MDAVSYSLASKQAQRIEKFIENPDSASGVLTVPKVIATGETITIPAGRVAVLPNVQVDGTLNISGEVFIPSGATFGDLENQIALKASLASPALTGTPTINGVNVSGYSGFKNYIINGGFNINQYPSFSNTSDGYKFDRWFVIGASAFSSMAIGSLNNEAASDKGLNFIKNGTADGFISQRIEFPRRLAGKTVTVSFSTYSVVSMNASVYFDGYNPTDGTAINLGNMRQNFTWGTGWVKRKFTFTLPSLNSNYNNVNSYIMLVIHIVNGSTTTDAWLTDVQMEEGSVATPFENRPYGLELSLCHRYFYNFNNYDALYRIKPATALTTIPFLVRMRTNPTITYRLEKDGVQQAVNSGATLLQANNEAVLFGVEPASYGYVDVMYFTASAEL